MEDNSKASILDFISKEDIASDLPPMICEEAITFLATLLCGHYQHLDRKIAVRAVLDREKVESTIIAPGIALPHARLPGLDKTMVAVGTSRLGIDFGVSGAEKVNVIILVLTPRSDAGTYLRLVAGISKVLRAPEMRGKLAACSSSREVHRLLSSTASPVPSYVKAKDVMDPKPVTLRESDDLAKVIEVLCRNGVMDVSITDEEGDLRGVIAIEQLLKLSLPEHLLWMEDLSPIMLFQPLSQFLLQEKEMKVADFMSENYVSVRAETPAIQLAKIFLTQGTRQIQVVEGRRLMGIVDAHNFVSELFWK